MCVHLISCVLVFAIPWTVACQALLSMEFSRQEYWSGLPFPTPGDVPNPGIKPTSFTSPALSGRFFFLTTVPPGNLQRRCGMYIQRNSTQPQKRTNNAICSNTDGHTDCQTERSQTQKDEHHIVYMWNLKKNGTNELTYKTEVKVQM